ncbi:MAG: hypothetical protein M5U26_16445 [Planctomycetota bacterium]|nr:hypothetical protein [Planctomycetota bacterium]
MGKLWRLAGLTLFVVTVLAPHVRAEGSRELTANGGQRPRLEYRDDFTPANPAPPLDGVQRRTVVYVYVQPGETLNLGSSATGIGNGRIVIRRPDNTIASSNSTTTGRINTRAQELAGPAPNAGGYTPWTLTVGALQGGVWEVHFAAPTYGNSDGNPAPIASTAQWPTQVTGTDSWFVEAWDVTVRDAGGQTILGRAFVNYFALMMGANSQAFNAILYVMTYDGYQYRINTTGLDPFGFIYFANNRGFKNPIGDPVYRSKDDPLNFPTDLNDPGQPDTWADITHKIFFNPPDPLLPLTANSPTPQPQALSGAGPRAGRGPHAAARAGDHLAPAPARSAARAAELRVYGTGRHARADGHRSVGRVLLLRLGQALQLHDHAGSG